MKNLLVSILAMTILTATAEARRDQNREQHQQNRIKQGVQSGALNRNEARNLRKGQKRVDHMQRKAMADGSVSPEEKLKIEKAQDRQSKLIYKQKHDGQKKGLNQPAANGQDAAASAPVEGSENN